MNNQSTLFNFGTWVNSVTQSCQISMVFWYNGLLRITSKKNFLHLNKLPEPLVPFHNTPLEILEVQN